MKRIWIVLLLTILLASCQAPNVDTTLLPGTDIIGYGEDWIDGGCEIFINDDIFDMKRANEVNTNMLGETEVVYEYTVRRETYLCKRIVKVVDVNPPVVTLEPGIDTIILGSEHIDAGVIAVDDIDPDPEVTVDNEVNSTQLGTYTITYTIADDFGNETSIVRYVHVIVNPN
jgi:hypothetical protein